MHVRLTDDTEMSARLAQQANAALALAKFIGGDPTERIAALLTASAVLIEREVGVALAPSAMMALIEPTLAAWQSPEPGQTRQ